MDTFIKYAQIIGGLVFVYLVVANGEKSTQVINSLSSANVGGIKALQGR